MPTMKRRTTRAERYLGPTVDCFMTSSPVRDRVSMELSVRSAPRCGPTYSKSILLWEEEHGDAPLLWHRGAVAERGKSIGALEVR